MSINRHNYEEFFLLYVDNELSAQERNAVDVFVDQNPDLGRELMLLQQSVLKQGDIVFEDKEGLLKVPELAALQERLLLFEDDELDFAETTEIKNLLVTDASAAKEWHILQKTKLQPDTAIVFPDKKSLYRTAGGRVVGFKWWRAVAAALLLGLGIWTGVTIYKNNVKTGATTESIANGNKTTAPQNTANNSSSVPVPVEPVIKTPIVPETVVTTNIQKDQALRPEEKTNPQKNVLPRDKNLPVKGNNNMAHLPADKLPGNNLPKPVLENINKIAGNKNETVIVEPGMNEIKNNLDKNAVAVNKTVVSVEPVKTIIDKNMAASTNTLAQNTLLSNTNETNNNDHILYMDEEKVKRTKIGGLFRKLKRVIERTTNIKMGNGIKVAGFEIAKQ